MLISAGQIISKSIALYRDNARLFFKYLAILFVPNVLLFAFTGFSDPAMTTVPTLRMGIVWFVLFIVAYVFILWITIAFMRAIMDRYEGRSAMEPKEEIRRSSPLIWPTIWVLILSGLAILGGFILLIIPGIIFSIWFAFSMYAVVLDGHKGGDALKTSKRLVQGRWWAVFWRLLAPGFVYAVVLLVAQGILTALNQWLLGNFGVGSTLGTVTNIIFGVLLTVVTLLVTPFSTAAPTILYSELKKTAVSPPVTPTATQS